MTDKQVGKFNIMLTEFLGYEVSEPNYPTDGYWFKHNELFDDSDYLEWAKTKDGFILIPPCFMKFHKDWNWLMCVIKKCNMIPVSLFKGDKRTLLESFKMIQEAVSLFDIDITYKAVCNYVEYYNKFK